MAVAALYDIHGNLPALDAVIAEMRGRGVDRLVVGGDVLPGPMPAETLARLRDLDLPVHYIRGNGEDAVLAEAAGRDSGVPEQFREMVRWTAGQLDASEHRRLAEWALTLRLEVPGIGDVLFCHATPRNNTEIFTRSTPDDRLRPVFADTRADLVVCGHTHMQFDRRVGDARIVNAGSVGMPFGGPGAYWLLIESGVELRRTHYDLARAAADVRATSYPLAEDFAARSILDPPTEESMLAAFARAELA